MDAHGILPARIPYTIAAHDCTNPATTPNIIMSPTHRDTYLAVLYIEYMYLLSQYAII